MKPQSLIEIAISSGCEITEYESHYCIRRDTEIRVIVTVPKVPQLVEQLVEKIKQILDL